MRSGSKYTLQIFCCLALACLASAQVTSHPTMAAHGATMKPAATAPAVVPAKVTPSKPVVRVNGAVITENDITRMMYTIFPYARQHGGVPKPMESEFRKGALEMVIFEELLYQEAQRRNLQVPPEKLARAEAAFRKQFHSPAIYQQYLALEANGSKAVMREKIRRSLLIDQMLKIEVEQKSAVSLAETLAFYNKNPKLFEHGETVSIQTISLIPPGDATPAMKKEATAKIKDIVRLGRAAKTKKDFGLLAEQLSEDDWRTQFGDRGTMDVKGLPPEVAKAAAAMKPGQVSDAIQVGSAWTVIRLNAHTPAGRTPFTQAKTRLQSDLHKQKREQVRSALNRNLRKTAKIENMS
jgi:parvulin-like peptidyl-prolyl isomerase